MHKKRFKITFFANFRKLQKKLPICKKKFAEILNVARAVVTNVEKKVKPINRIFFTSAKVAPDCSIKDSFFGSFIHSELGDYRLYFKFKTNIVCIKVKINLYRMKDLSHFSTNHSTENN